MSSEELLRWFGEHASVTAGGAGLCVLAVSAVVRRSRRRAPEADHRSPPAAVIVTALAAVGCTAYSADTSWRFAEHVLGMVGLKERAALFAAGELALFAVALMARQNLREKGMPGTPGVLVWVITGVQVIPAFAESGFWGGIVRAFVGPIMAAWLWHLAMGIELRHRWPGAESQSLPSVLWREGRERLLSRLGLAVRDRTAEQITRDRWTVKAVSLAARLADMAPDDQKRERVARKLSVAVGRAQAGAHPEQKRMLLQLLAARRHARSLATVVLPSPWTPEAESVVRPRSLAAVAHGALAGMHPVDAVRTVADAHPHLAPAELASLLVAHGVVVSANQVEFAVRGTASAHSRGRGRASAAGQPRSRVAACWAPEERMRTDASDVPDADADKALLPDALRVDEDARAETGRPASLRRLQTELRIGQKRAQRMQRLLTAPAESADEPLMRTADSVRK
ncbi:flagellar biosynthesis protein FlhF [Streptomyces rimosus]|uniref:hypothetical protein n=1 Tax=Streptomyces rimosus TaxID=1927 RepID=UPI000A66B615|nr:hypothetical protein [Streptomyces rimosus]